MGGGDGCGAAGLSGGELQHFWSSWQKQIQPAFHWEFPVWPLFKCCFRFQPCNKKKITATKPNSIFKKKLHQSFDLTSVSSEEGTGGVHTDRQLSLCVLQALACRCGWHQGPFAHTPAVSRTAGLRISRLSARGPAPAWKPEWLSMCVSARAGHAQVCKVFTILLFSSIGMNTMSFWDKFRSATVLSLLPTEPPSLCRRCLEDA